MVSICRGGVPVIGYVADRAFDANRSGRPERRPTGVGGALAGYFAVIRIEPSSRMVSPLSISFSTICFTSAAYSAGRPRRDGNGTCWASYACASGGSPAIIGVSNRPGAMVHTRMP